MEFDDGSVHNVCRIVYEGPELGITYSSWGYLLWEVLGYSREEYSQVFGSLDTPEAIRDALRRANKGYKRMFKGEIPCGANIRAYVEDWDTPITYYKTDERYLGFLNVFVELCKFALREGFRISWA